MEILKPSYTQTIFSEIGKEFSDNHSSTLRSKLIGVSQDGQYCAIEEVENWGKAPKAGVKSVPTWYVDNCIYGV